MLAMIVLCARALNAAQLEVSVNDAAGKPLMDAVAYLVPAAPGKLPAAQNIEIDQKDRMFQPAVSVIQVGGLVAFPNSDNIRHQVYSFSPAKKFNLKLYSGRQSEPVQFDTPGAVVMGCNIHDQMVAWLLVVDSAWFGKTDRSGRALITRIPDGKYTLKLWHPGQHAEGSAVALQINGDLSKTLTLDADPVTSGMHHSAADH